MRSVDMLDYPLKTSFLVRYGLWVLYGVLLVSTAFLTVYIALVVFTVTMHSIWKTLSRSPVEAITRLRIHNRDEVILQSASGEHHNGRINGVSRFGSQIILLKLELDTGGQRLLYLAPGTIGEVAYRGLSRALRYGFLSEKPAPD